MDFIQFVRRRWSEVEERLGLSPGLFHVTSEVKDGYPHFKKKRGYAVCFHQGDAWCHVQFAPKILKAPFHRVDGLVRHELGHAVDFFVPEGILNDLAARDGVALPVTPERRADAIAYWIWGEPLRYDADLVQSTHIGSVPRPEHLGL